MMQCVVLCEQKTNSEVPALKGIAGLSIYVEYDDRKILVNTGPDETAFRNAKLLGIDLSLVDTIIITGGLHELGGGLRYVENSAALRDVIVTDTCFAPRYKKVWFSKKWVGLDEKSIDHLREKVVVISDNYSMAPDMQILMSKNIKESVDGNIASNRFFVGEDQAKDQYLDECVLCIQSWNRLTLIAGSPRAGILDVMNYVDGLYHMPLHSVITGFELRRSPNRNGMKVSIYHVEQLAKALLRESVGTYYSVYSTGKKGFGFLFMWMGKRIAELKIGDRVDL